VANSENDIGFEKIKLEQDKFRLDQSRLRLDEERFKVEKKFKAWTMLSIVIPLIVIAVSVSISVWSQYKQAQTDFVLRAVDTVMTSKSPSEAQNKLNALLFLFPNQMPDDFSTLLSKFNSDDFSEDSNYENKMNFLNLMANSGASKEEILEMYNELFPESSIYEAVVK